MHKIQSSHVARATAAGRDWLILELTATDGVLGQSWAPDSVELRATIEAPESTDPLARGLVAAAEVDILCQRHGVPLHVWFGGPVRRDIRVSWPVVLGKTAAVLAQACDRARDAASTLGITSFVVHDQATTDIDAVALAVATVRTAVGPEAALSVRLGGQFEADQARTLLAKVRAHDLVTVADPCQSVAQNVEAARGQLPALGLSAWRYDREELLACLASAPPAALIVDPLIEGGPWAVRHLASIARVLQTDVILTAERGNSWLTRLCTELAAVEPACHLPIELPADVTASQLHELGISDGRLRPASAPGVLTVGETIANNEASVRS